MHTIDWYLDQARTATRTPSDAQLAKHLGLHQTSVSGMRTGRHWPDDHTMIILAKIVGIDPAEALLDLNRWRAKTPEVAREYQKIHAQLARLAVLLALVFVGVAGPMGTERAQALTVSADLYIMRITGVGPGNIRRV